MRLGVSTEMEYRLCRLLVLHSYHTTYLFDPKDFIKSTIMAEVKASPMLAFYKFISTGKIESNNNDEEQGALLDANARTTTPNYHTTADEEVAKEISEKEETQEPEESLNLFSWYAKLLDKYPLLVKAVTAFFILGLGDAAAQGVENLRGSDTPFDWIRAIRFGAFGLLGAPWAHYYYFFLDHFFPPTEKPFSSITALKLFIDQGIQAPTLLALIISCLALLKGIGLVGVRADMKAHYMNALIANCTLRRFDPL